MAPPPAPPASPRDPAPAGAAPMASAPMDFGPMDPGRVDAASVEVLGVLGAVQSLATTLAVARALVEAGRAVELDGLDAEAARLCAALACLGPGAVLHLRPPLEEALAEITRLEAALRRP